MIGDAQDDVRGGDQHDVMGDVQDVMEDDQDDVMGDVQDVMEDDQDDVMGDVAGARSFQYQAPCEWNSVPIH